MKTPQSSTLFQPLAVLLARTRVVSAAAWKQEVDGSSCCPGVVNELSHWTSSSIGSSMASRTWASRPDRGRKRGRHRGGRRRCQRLIRWGLLEYKNACLVAVTGVAYCFIEIVCSNDMSCCGWGNTVSPCH